MNNKLSLFALYFIATSCFANTCENIIALSKTSSSTTQNRNDIEEYANQFCKEYAKNKGDTKASSYGASYGVLSGSASSSGSSVNSVKSKYCSASESGVSKKSAYKNYIETISPRAYGAYEKCVEWSKKDLRFDVDMASVLDNEFSISIHFNSSTTGAKAELNFKPSQNVNCSWEGLDSKKVTMSDGNTKLLSCSRENIQREDYVKIYRSNGDGFITIPWKKYNKNGIAVDDLRMLTESYKHLKQNHQNLVNSIEGAIIAFELNSCPDGWSEYEKAYGRFIRGFDKSGEKRDPDEKRKVGSIQNDSLKSHNHSISTAGIHNRSFKGDNNGAHTATEKKGNTTSSGDKETRPKNVALLYCQKTT